MEPDLTALCQELVRRGWWVTAAERTNDSVIVGFNLMPRATPNWLKAFELPHALATPGGFEREIETWRSRVRADLENNKASDVVRHLMAEHGPEKVREALNATAFV